MTIPLPIKGWWEADPEARTHEVMVLCMCTDDPCRMEVYVSDVRILERELARLRAERWAA